MPKNLRTIDLPALDLTEDHTLVGDHGGLSAIMEPVRLSSFKEGFVTVVTEHGYLMLDPDREQTYTALDPNADPSL